MRKLLAVLLALVVPATVLPGRPAAAARAAASVRHVAAASVWHVVAPGETMPSIARDFGLSAADIGRWNQIVAPYPVHVDETLRLTPPAAPLPAWRTRIEPVTAAMVNWNPALHCPVPPAALRRVWVSYIDLQGAYHDGSIIVHRDLAVRVQNIFLTLFRWRYRIMAMAPTSVNMPDTPNMAIVTAGYSCRPVGGTDVWSEHAFGTAIDINPLQNPMLRGGSVSPAGGSYYLDRSRYLIGMIHPEGAGRAFTENGYFWGGQWRSVKDYMHFSVTNR